MDPQLKRALSQALRVEILERIATSPASPRQLAAATGEPLGRIVYHASVLHRTGCVRPVDAEADPGSSDCVLELATLLPSPPRLALSGSTRGHVLATVLRRIVEQGFGALRGGTLGRDPAHIASCESILLDEEGWGQTRTILAETKQRIAEAREAAARRLATDDRQGIPTTVALAAFETAPEADESA